MPEKRRPSREPAYQHLALVLGDLILRMRERQGMTTMDLVAATGIDKATLWGYETGARLIPLYALLTVAEVLDADVPNMLRIALGQMSETRTRQP